MRFFLIMLCSLFSIIVFSQENSETSFKKAQELAQKENYQEAIEVCQNLILEEPGNDDYKLYLARLYLWSGEPESAKEIVKPLIKKEKASLNPNQDVFRLFIQILISEEQFDEVVNVSNYSIHTFSSEKDYYKTQKALALIKLKKSKEVMSLLEEIKESSTYYKSALYLRTQALREQKNLITVSHLNTTFSSPSSPPWNISSFEYKRSTPKSAYVGRLTHGYLFGNSAFQMEFDAYPQLGDNSYLYLNGGFSDGKSVFPVAKVGAEYFKTYKKYDLSIGGRYFYFDQTELLMLTGHVGRTFNSYNISYRPYLVNQGGSWFTTHVLNLGKNFEEKEAFVQLDLQYGAVPYYFFIGDVFLRASSYRGGINFRFRVMDNFFIQPVLMYELEEFIPDNYRNRYNVQITLSRRF